MIFKKAAVIQGLSFGTIFSKAKKGISPVVATSLLLVVAVGAVVGFNTWYDTFSSSLFVDTELKSNNANSNMGVEDLIGENLYIQTGANNLSISAIEIEGIDCNISGSYTGMQSFNVSSCLSNLSVNDPEIVVITENGILSEYVYYEDANFTTSSLSGSSFGSDFVSTWNTSLTSAGSSNSTTIVLPLEGSGTYSFDIDWGDGTQEFINNEFANHTYASAGVYNITINGTIVGFRFNNNGDRLKLLDIKNWGSLRIGNNNNYFYGAENMIISANDALNLTGTTSLYQIFREADSLTGNINNWNTSDITSLYGAFVYTDNFNEPLNNWDVSSVTNMYATFGNAWSFNQSLSNWDVSSVTNFGYMFNQAYDFNQNISGWNTSSGQDMEAMFSNAEDFNYDLSSWEVQSVTDMRYMFRYTDNFNQNLSSWNTSNVLNMDSMFYDADAFNQDLSGWDVHNVTDMDSMFAFSNIFNGTLTSWNVSGVTTCTNFNQSTPSWSLSNQPTFSSCTP